ncbi:hypothetical protein [Roseomonas sp. 18066]|uniref:hypothetical protein n=1 Tax=Roseomonas sp. 18066 TaxID=2681412 RepID=UPI00135C74BF|nr:hypothetical protein [Roseomonas sp. 18066]
MPFNYAFIRTTDNVMQDTVGNTIDAAFDLTGLRLVRQPAGIYPAYTIAAANAGGDVDVFRIAALEEGQDYVFRLISHDPPGGLSGQPDLWPGLSFSLGYALGGDFVSVAEGAPDDRGLSLSFSLPAGEDTGAQTYFLEIRYDPLAGRPAEAVEYLLTADDTFANLPYASSSLFLRVIGTAADESFVITHGPERIEAGDGLDEVIFDSTLANWAPSRISTRHVIADDRLGAPYSTDEMRAHHLYDVERLVFTDGTIDLTRTGDVLVDDVRYWRYYTDVWNAGLDPAEHYDASGWREGRNPNAYFDTNAYLAANRDVAAAGVNPLEHYQQHGRGEGRDPGIGFDAQFYLARNPDVAAAGLDPLSHYLANGIEERRPVARAAGPVIEDGFDAQFYLMSNPDVAASGVDARSHYLETGWREGRDPNAYFDVDQYLSLYPDVQAAGVEPLAHYNANWPTRNLDPSGYFDTGWYLTLNTDVREAGINPLQHFLQFGLNEGRYLEVFGTDPFYSS